jgi:hypothetical protein
MKSRVLYLLLCFCSTIAIFIVGCIFYSSTGVFSSGKDTYTVVVSGRGNPWPVDMLKLAHEEANNFCQSKGKLFQPVATKVVPASQGLIHSSNYSSEPLVRMIQIILNLI